MNADMKRKLTLNRETIRVLSAKQMNEIAGGADAGAGAVVVTVNCPTLKCISAKCMTLASCPGPVRR